MKKNAQKYLFLIQIVIFNNNHARQQEEKWLAKK